jgi:hypothetical protein
MEPENDFLYWSPDGEGNNLLCEHFGIEMPAGYHEFALRDRQS